MTQDLVPLLLDNNFFPSFSPTLFHLGLFLKISIEKSSDMGKYNRTKKKEMSAAELVNHFGCV